MSATVSALAPAAEGTCIQLTEAPSLWAVRGTREWYRCDPERGACNCADWLYRRARTVTPCKHLRALESYRLTAAVVRAAMTAAPMEEERAPLPSDDELRRIFA